MEKISELYSRTPVIFPVYLIAASTILAVIVSAMAMASGWFIIFQNIFYIPIIIACIYYGRKGFAFSVLVSFIYLAMIFMYTADTGIIAGAMVRVAMFVIVAGVITYISLKLRCAEEIKSDTEQKLNDIIEFLPDPTFLIDREKRVIAWNRAIERVTGVKKKDIIGKGDHAYASVIYGDERPILVDAILSGEEPEPGYSSIKKDGHSISIVKHYDSLNGREDVDLLLTAAPFYNTKGKIIGAIEYVHDITELRQNEKVLRENEAYLRTLIRTIPDLIWLKDENGVYFSCNEIFERFFGAKEEEIIGKTDYDFLDKETADFFRENDRRAVEAGMPRINEERITFADDGHIADLETIKTPMYDSDGKLIGVLGIGRDITRRKEMENELRESGAELRQLSEDLRIIFDNAPAMIFYKDTKNNFIRVNPKVAEKFGMPIEEIEGKHGQELFPQYRDIYFRDDVEIIESGKPKLGIIESMKTASGETLWVSTDKIPLKDPDGKVYGILLFATDITEQKKNQDALKEVNKKINLLSSITRHDILNQITGAAGYLSLIELDREVPEGTKTSGYLRKLSEIIETIKRQISFTGYYKDLGGQAPQWFDVGEIVTKAGRDLDPGRIELINNIEGAWIFADPLFEKVIYNLIDNAIKHGDKITEISFYTETTPEELRIICEDDGIGIPDDAKEKIFRREYYKNSGLGLFLSKEILDITGLSIDETGEYGKGARFVIHVPEGKYRIN